MRLIDADAYAAKMKDRQSACREWIEDAKAEGDEAQIDRARQAYGTFVEAKLTLDAMPTIDAIPVGWLEDKLNATAVTNPDLNNAIFYTLVAWEQEKKNHEQ